MLPYTTRIVLIPYTCYAPPPDSWTRCTKCHFQLCKTCFFDAHLKSFYFDRHIIKNDLHRRHETDKHFSLMSQCCPLAYHIPIPTPQVLSVTLVHQWEHDSPVDHTSDIPFQRTHMWVKFGNAITIFDVPMSRGKGV